MPNVPISQEQLIKIKQLSRKLRHALCHSTNPSPNDFLHFYNSELFSWTPPIQNSFETNLPTHYPDFEEIESSSPEKVSSKKNFELISSEKPLPKLKKIKTSHETHSSETLQPMDTISPSISESSPSLNLNPSSTFKHANSHPHLFTDFLEASTSLSMPLHSNNTSGIYDETLSSTLATLEVTSSPISCLPHPQPNDERRDSPSWTMAHLKVPTSLDSQRTQPLQRSPTPHLPSLMESSPQSMTDRHMTTMSPSSPPAQVSTMLTPSTPIMMLHSSPNDSSPTTGITMLLPPSRRVFSSPDETPFFPSSSPMLPPLFIHSPSSKSIQPSSSLLMLEDPFMMDSTKSPTACFNQTNSTMHPISLNLLSQEVKEISNTEPLTDQEQGYEMKYIEEESGNSSLRARHTKVLARNKIVRLFHRYGDFVKLKPSEKGDVSDSDPDLEDLGSQNSNSSSSTGSHSLDLPFSQHTTYSPHSSPSNSLAPPSPFGSNDVNSHPSFNASSLSKKKIISIPSKRSLWTRPKSLLTPAATTFVENPKSLFDRMQVKSVKKKKYMDPSYLSTLPTSVLTPFLYPSLEETELPIFLRVAARTILRNISTTMPRSKKINQLYGDPKKKYISFQSSKPVLFALTKEIHDAQLGETTNVLSLLEKGIRPYSKRHRTPRVEGRPLARPNFPRSNHQMKKKSMRPTRRPLKPSFYMSGSHLDPSSNTILEYDEGQDPPLALDTLSKPDEENDMKDAPSSNQPSLFTSHSHQQLLKRQPRLESTPKLTMERDPCHAITILNVPDTCTFCTLTILGGDTFSLEQTFTLYDVNIVPSNIAMLQPYVKDFVLKFFEDAKNHHVIQPHLGPVMTHFLDTQFVTSSYAIQMELREILLNCMIHTRKIRKEKQNSPALFILSAWVALWLFMIHETNAIFQIETLSLLLKQCKFPLDVPFLDPFQALILLSFHHPVSCSELLELCFLHPTIEGQWVYIFSVQVIQNLLCPKPERVMNWEVLHTLVMKTESLALALSRVFTLVHVYQWCPFQKEMLYTFKDLYFHTLTPIKLDVLLPPVTTGSSLPEQFLYLYDQISFASELEKQDFTMRLLPSHFSHLTLTKVPSLLGLFLRVEGGDVSRFFTQLSCIPRFPYSLPTFYLTLVAHRPLFRPFLFKFLLHQLHKAFETDSMLTQHLLELLVTCSSSYPHELVEKVVESWSTVVGTWLNPHYVHFHRWMVILVLRNLFHPSVSITRHSPLTLDSAPHVSITTVKPSNVKNRSIDMENVNEHEKNEDEDEEDDFFLSAALEAESRYLNQTSEQVKPILFTLEHSILTMSLHLRPDEIQLNLLEWQTSTTSSLSLFVNTLYVAAMLLRIVEQVHVVTTEAILCRWTSLRWPSMKMPHFVKCFRSLLFIHHFYTFGAKISDTRITELFTISAFDPLETPLHLLLIQDFLSIHEENTLLKLCDLSDLFSASNTRSTLVAATFHSIGVSIQHKKLNLLSLVYQILPHLQILCSVAEQIADLKSESLSPVHQLFSIISLESGIQQLQLPEPFIELTHKLQSVRSPVASMLSYFHVCNKENTEGLQYALMKFTTFIQDATMEDVVAFLSQISKDLRVSLFQHLLEQLEKNSCDWNILQSTLEIFTSCFTRLPKITFEETQPITLFLPRLAKFLDQTTQVGNLISKSLWNLLSILLNKLCYLTQPRVYFPESNFHALSSIVRMLFPLSLLQVSKFTGKKIEIPFSIMTYHSNDFPFYLLKHQLQLIEPGTFNAPSDTARNQVELQLFESLINFLASCYLSDYFLRDYLIGIQKSLTDDLSKSSATFYALWSTLYLNITSVWCQEPYTW